MGSTSADGPPVEPADMRNRTIRRIELRRIRACCWACSCCSVVGCCRVDSSATCRIQNNNTQGHIKKTKQKNIKLLFVPTSRIVLGTRLISYKFHLVPTNRQRSSKCLSFFGFFLSRKNDLYGGQQEKQVNWPLLAIGVERKREKKRKSRRLFLSGTIENLEKRKKFFFNVSL